MPRIQKAFDRRFRDLFAELGARDRDKGLAWMHRKARQLLDTADPLLSKYRAPSISHAYSEIAIAILNRTRSFRQKRERHHPSTDPRPPRVHCDAGLGGLARWLRAAGCEAFWRQDITDAELVGETQQLGGILLTTDSLLLDRRPIVRGEVQALWVPPTLTIQEQLRYVWAELDLRGVPIESRCMRCGGEIIEVNKEQVRDRIPPRTYNWLSEFFECTSCHQLFWEGTHWQRIFEIVGQYHKDEERPVPKRK